MAHRQLVRPGYSASFTSKWWHANGCKLFLLCILFCNQILIAFTCPDGCFCGAHTRSVQCANKNIDHIPKDIDPDTMELNLNKNQFRNRDLARRNFTHLPYLQNLYLSECGIETISVDTFADLVHLKWLDISKNNIRFVPDFTFRGLDLKHLFINGNQGIQFSLGAFAGLSTKGLYLYDCSLKKLPVDLMSPLTDSLKILWIHENNFEQFSHKWLYFFEKLATVRLGGNAFHCNCEIQWLYSFFQKSKGTLFDSGDNPECASPLAVRGKTFQELTESDFRCDLPTFKNLDAVFDSKMGKLTCEAKGDPAPTLYWSSPDGTTETFYPDKEDQENKENTGVLFLTNPKLENKDAYKCVASNPAGNVTFALNIVWPDLRSATIVTKAPVRESNVIHAGTTQSPSDRIFKNFAGDDSDAYNWDSVNSLESSKMAHGAGSRGGSNRGRKVGESSEEGHHFTIIDIVGAVVGTFILTLLICITAFHYYQKRRDNLIREDEHHYSEPNEVNNKRSPNDVFIMNETDDNRIKMINHSQYCRECPS